MTLAWLFCSARILHSRHFVEFVLEIVENRNSKLMVEFLISSIKSLIGLNAWGIISKIQLLVRKTITSVNFPCAMFLCFQSLWEPNMTAWCIMTCRLRLRDVCFLKQ